MVAHHTIDLQHLVLGLVVFLMPGLVWTWALTPQMAWAYRIPLSVVVAFTVLPALMFLLNLVLRVPITLVVQVSLAALLTVAGLLMVVRQHPEVFEMEEA